jgi:hypothetical protein
MQLGRLWIWAEMVHRGQLAEPDPSRKPAVETTHTDDEIRDENNHNYCE